MTTTASSTIFEHMFRAFGLRENPFHVSPDPRFLYLGPAYEATLAELMFGIESHKGLLVLTADAGMGKTTLVRHLLHWLERRKFSSSFIFHSHLDTADLFESILRDFGAAVESTKKSDLLATLQSWLLGRQSAGDTPVVIIDEAQALSVRTLSELSQLLNLEGAQGKLLQVVLAGQPELNEKLRRPDLRSLRQRIMVRCRLPLLTLEDTADYINARLRGAGAVDPQIFPQQTVQTIYSYARGIPRVTNLLCEHALNGAYADCQTTVSPTNVRRVAAEFDLVGEPYFGLSVELPLEPRQALQALEPAHPEPAETPQVQTSNEVTPPSPLTAAIRSSMLVRESTGRTKEPATTIAAATEPAASTRPTPMETAPLETLTSASPSEISPQAASVGFSAKAPDPGKPEPPKHTDLRMAEPERLVIEPEQPSIPTAPPAAAAIPAISGEPSGELLALAAAAAASASSRPVSVAPTSVRPSVGLPLSPVRQPAAASENGRPPTIVTAPASRVVEFTVDADRKGIKPKLTQGYGWAKNPLDLAWAQYWREVTYSFRKDAKALWASGVPSMKTLARTIQAWGKAGNAKLATAGAQCRKWLATPSNKNGRSDTRSNVASIRRRKS